MVSRHIIRIFYKRRKRTRIFLTKLLLFFSTLISLETGFGLVPYVDVLESRS